jgi:hypothetical protein
MFSEESIETFLADQLLNSSLELARKKIEDTEFHLIIDAGLHVPEAALNTILNFWGLLKPGGYYVIEDTSLYLKDFDIAVSITSKMNEFQFIDMSKLTFRNNNCLAVFKKVEH